MLSRRKEPLCGISFSFPKLSPTRGQITHALLTRSPLYLSRRTFAFDLHVLGTPPAFVLSQDQTLQFKPVSKCVRSTNQTYDAWLVISKDDRDGRQKRPFATAVSDCQKLTVKCSHTSQPNFQRAHVPNIPCDGRRNIWVLFEMINLLSTLYFIFFRKKS